MNGYRVGQLSVYLNILKENNILVEGKEPIWRMASTHGDHWNLAHIQYDGGNKSINNFIIEAFSSYASYSLFYFLIFQFFRLFKTSFFLIFIKILGEIALGK